MASDPKHLVVPGPSRFSGGGLLNLNLRRAQHVDGYIISLESPTDARRLSIDVTPEALFEVGRWIQMEIEKRTFRSGT